MDEHNVQQDKRKTSTFTLRIDENIIKSLQNESQLQDISLNTLINKILKRYVEWDAYEPKVGMIPMTKPVITTL
ncbi:MAG: toxin-antitoxin system HicB family antitoxin, partial [Nitrososphaeraceae archaeon]|nr:toxin-antitoxin system HicB family antitoxin [Nitrososphaeraceae archaeon]